MSELKTGNGNAADTAARGKGPDYEKVHKALMGFKEECLLEGVPMLGFYAVGDYEGGETEYRSAAVTPLELGVELEKHNDRVTVLSAALSGERIEVHPAGMADSGQEAADALAEMLEDDDEWE